MAKLTLIEKGQLEKLLDMGGGYVLDFTDATFADFFREQGINIDHPKYTKNKISPSKANRLRGFWEQERNTTVGVVIEKLIPYAEYLANERGITKADKKLIFNCRNIANKLTGKPTQIDTPTLKEKEEEFLTINFGEINFSKLPIEGQLQPILKSRLGEAEICLRNNANLAAIFMAGSILEGVLLGVTQKYPRQFNESPSCPKDDRTGKPKKFSDWTLSQLIDVGRNINLLGEDVAKFSHALRDFRNYIHPHQQMATGFNPNKDTANICLQVLKAAFSDLTEDRHNR